jgi:hypothetical protein
LIENYLSIGAILGSTGGMIRSMYWPFFFSVGGKKKNFVFLVNFFFIEKFH